MCQPCEGGGLGGRYGGLDGLGVHQGEVGEPFYGLLLVEEFGLGLYPVGYQLDQSYWGVGLNGGHPSEGTLWGGGGGGGGRGD